MRFEILKKKKISHIDKESSGQPWKNNWGQHFNFYSSKVEHLETWKQLIFIAGRGWLTELSKIVDKVTL